MYQIDILQEMGEFEEALEVAESLPDPFRLDLSIRPLYALGRQSELESAFQEILELMGEEDPARVAMAYAYTGQVDTAFEWLDRLPSDGPGFAASFSQDPLYANLFDDPRWAAFLERVGQVSEELPAIQFEVRLPR